MMKIKWKEFSLSSLSKRLGSPESMKENLIQSTKGHIRVAKEWMTVEEYRRRFLCERCDSAEPEK